MPTVTQPGSTTTQPAMSQKDSTPVSMNSYFFDCITSKFAVFSGRACRKEYWAFQLYTMLTLVVLVVIAAFAGAFSERTGSAVADAGGLVIAMGVGFGFMLILVPAAAVQVRRLHDIGMSGWWAMLGAIPTVGTFVLWMFALMPGHPTDNDYGPTPF